MFSPADQRHPIGLAASLTASGIRLPLPGGGEVIYNSSGLSNYRHPNWQGSQPLMSFPTESTPTYGSAFTPFGEKYAVDSSGSNGYFAGMLGVADKGAISDAYQADARLMHQAEGRWISPDPAGMSAVDMTNPQSWNRYAYVLNNPLNLVDPSGLANCEPPLVLQPGKNGEPSTCVAGNPSTTSNTVGNCAQAIQENGGAPVAGCPGSTPNGNQSVTGQPSNNGRVANNITCGTILPNGRTVGSYVNQLSNSINGSAGNPTSTPYSPGPNPGAPGPISIASQVFSGTNFRKMFGGPDANFEFLGDAGNFAYAAVSANIGVPFIITELVAGGYTLLYHPFSDLGPYGMDPSARVQIPAGYRAACKVP